MSTFVAAAAATARASADVRDPAASLVPACPPQFKQANNAPATPADRSIVRRGPTTTND
jgi:hypothetical protein